MNLMEALIAAQLAGSGSGSGGGMELILVTFSYTEGLGFSCDKTLAEITAAKDAGKYVEGVYDGQYCPLVRLSNDAAVFQRLASSSGVDMGVLMVGAKGVLGDFVRLALAEAEVNVSGSDAVIYAQDNTIYQCGELTSLTIDSYPASGMFAIVFTSGATATTTTFPATILGLEDFAAEANTTYEINVLDGRAVVGSWEVSAA